MPSRDAFEAAVQAARPFAEAHGLSLHTDGLWQRLLAARVPLMALRQGTRCHIGYSAFTPGRRFDGLFPDLAAAQAQVWLSGLVRHELAHCLEDGAGDAVRLTQGRWSMAAWGAPGAQGAPTQRWREAGADLAFALHVDRRGAHGEGLVERLLQFRQASAGHDPDHDSTPVLRCYLEHPARRVEAAQAASLGDAAAAQGWRAAMDLWQTRCPMTAVP